jgi:hypothetical protein
MAHPDSLNPTDQKDRDARLKAFVADVQARRTEFAKDGQAAWTQPLDSADKRVDKPLSGPDHFAFGTPTLKARGPAGRKRPRSKDANLRTAPKENSRPPPLATKAACNVPTVLHDRSAAAQDDMDSDEEQAARIDVHF